MAIRQALRQSCQGQVVVQECAIPQPGCGEALIRVGAVALNPIDWKMMYRQNVTETPVLGCDFVGVVKALGPNVIRIKLGERVAGMTQGGW